MFNKKCKSCKRVLDVSNFLQAANQIAFSSICNECLGLTVGQSFLKCDKCEKLLISEKFKKNFNICASCAPQKSFICHLCEKRKSQSFFKYEDQIILVCHKCVKLETYNKSKLKSLCRKQTIWLIEHDLLKKSEHCEICESKNQVQSHHLSYDDPFNILWLCSSCHRIAHILKVLEDPSFSRSEKDNKIQSFKNLI